MCRLTKSARRINTYEHNILVGSLEVGICKVLNLVNHGSASSTFQLKQLRSRIRFSEETKKSF